MVRLAALVASIVNPPPPQAVINPPERNVGALWP